MTTRLRRCTGARDRDLPDAILEDPHDLPAAREAIAPHSDRVSYDALITEADDLDKTPVNPIRVSVNIKPCRTGSLRRRSRSTRAARPTACSCTAADGRARGRARADPAFASIFHPDGPNDVAPSPFNGPAPGRGLADEPKAPRDRRQWASAES